MHLRVACHFRFVVSDLVIQDENFWVCRRQEHLKLLFSPRTGPYAFRFISSLFRNLTRGISHSGERISEWVIFKTISRCRSLPGAWDAGNWYSSTSSKFGISHAHHIHIYIHNGQNPFCRCRRPAWTAQPGSIPHNPPDPHHGREGFLFSRKQRIMALSVRRMTINEHTSSRNPKAADPNL